MSPATILPRNSVRIRVYGKLAARRRTCVNGRSNVRCSRSRVTSLRRVSVPISIASGVPSVPILSAVGLGGVGASSRTVRMNGLPVVIPRSDFAMLQKRKEKEIINKMAVWAATHQAKNSTVQPTAAVLTLAQALEQKLCSTPEAGSSHLGRRWQFYVWRMRSRTESIDDHTHTSQTLLWLMLFLLLVVRFWVPARAARVVAIGEDCRSSGSEDWVRSRAVVKIMSSEASDSLSVAKIRVKVQPFGTSSKLPWSGSWWL